MNKRLEELMDKAAAENAASPTIALDNIANTFRRERECDFIRGSNYMYAELMPRVERMVENLDIIATQSTDLGSKYLARTALTEWREFMGEGKS